MVELLSKDLVQFDWLRCVLADCQACLCESDSMLESRPTQNLILLHCWLDLLKVPVQECCHDGVLVVVDFVSVEVLILLNQLFKCFVHAVIGIDRETSSTETLKVQIVDVGEFFDEIRNERSKSKL